MQNGNRYDLSQLTDQEGVALCEELRKKLIASVSQTGGHLASNLGVVELTVALHRVYDTSKDRLVFDVGHQCYVHKILTGREEEMSTLRSFGGLSGFPKPKESVHDAFIAGHASNSVSVAVGMARARTLLHQDYNVIALIGDGALTGGLAYEGLSDAGASGENLLVILNDNGMSITRNVGGISKLLARQHLRPRYLALKRGYRNAMMKTPVGTSVYNVSSKIKKNIKGTLLPSSFFEDMGFTYLGPVNGHDLSELTRLLKWAKSLTGPVLLHVRTVKGKAIHQRNAPRTNSTASRPLMSPRESRSARAGPISPPYSARHFASWRRRTNESAPARRRCSPAPVSPVLPSAFPGASLTWGLRRAMR